MVLRQFDNLYYSQLNSDFKKVNVGSKQTTRTKFYNAA